MLSGSTLTSIDASLVAPDVSVEFGSALYMTQCFLHYGLNRLEEMATLAAEMYLLTDNTASASSAMPFPYGNSSYGTEAAQRETL